MKNLSSVTLAALLVLIMAGFGCGSGSHLISVAVSPNPANLNAPQTLQLQAVGTYSDGTTKVLSSAAWTFSSPSPAVTVDGKGLANCLISGGLAATAGTVTASFSGRLLALNFEGPALRPFSTNRRARRLFQPSLREAITRRPDLLSRRLRIARNVPCGFSLTGDVVGARL